MSDRMVVCGEARGRRVASPNDRADSTGTDYAAMKDTDRRFGVANGRVTACR
jgi:hypothetical protein